MDPELLWSPAPPAPRPPTRAEVHVWAIDLSAPAPRALERVLSTDERERAAGTPSAAERARFVAARAALREILGTYLEVEPGAIRLRYAEQGKPALAEPAADLRFSVSHAGGLALLAFGRGREVGIDVERVRAVSRPERILARLLSADEVRAWRELPEDRRRDDFFRRWTRLEALAKLGGAGVWKSAMAGTLRERAGASLLELAPAAGYAAALAAEGEPPEVRCWARAR